MRPVSCDPYLPAAGLAIPQTSSQEGIKALKNHQLKL
jgi:hypothetical protein